MSGRLVPLMITLAAALACAGPYAERPPASGTDEGTTPDRRRAEPVATPARGTRSEGTVIGQVTPDGRLDADTVAQAPAPDPVDRETVVTGYVRAAGTAGGPDAAEAPGAAAFVAGWRIQVFAARDEATATQVARRAGDAVEGVPVYVEPEESWFKVRLGDFATREAAEPLRERLIGLGWTEAWAVPTMVHAP